MKLLSFTLFFAALITPSFLSAATDEPSKGPFEIVEVTAQKRLQKVQDISISITALSGDTLNALGIVTTNEIAAQLPGVTISDIAGTPNNVLISIRGSSQNDIGDHNESPNAVYIDEAYIGAIGGVGIQLFDLDRVEVLRGPQGTLFGRNTTGGLIHFITKKPTAKTNGYLKTEYGDFNRTLIEGAVGGGNDQVSGRVSAQYLKQDGYIKNRIGDDMLAFERSSLRAQLLLTPIDDIEVLLKASYSRNDDQPGSSYEHRASFADPNDHDRGRYITDDMNPHDTCNGCDFFGYRDPDGDDVWTSDINRTDSITDRKINTLTARFKWALDDFSVAAITDYQHTKKTYEEDCDGSPTAACGFGTFGDTSQFSQELRIDGAADDFQWVVGSNYLSIDGDYEIHLWADVYDYFPSSLYQLETESFAVFGQLEYELAADWMLTFGSRWTRDLRQFSLTSRLLSGPDVTLPSEQIMLNYDDSFIADRLTNRADCLAMGGSYSDDELTADFGGLCDKTGLFSTPQSDSSYSLKLALDHHIDEDTMVYGSFSRGAKGGGYSAPFAAVLKAEQLPYDSETILNYEAGFKATFNQQTFVTGAVFYADYQDYQAFDLQGLTQVIVNRDAYLKGLELELLLVHDDNWTFNFGLSVLEAKVKGMVLPDGTIQSTHLPQAPEYTFNALVHKRWPRDDGSQWSAQIDLLASGPQYFSIANHQTTYENGYVIGNARFSYTDASGLWETSFWIKNLTQEKYATYGFDLSGDFGSSVLSYSPPRTIGLTLTRNFGK
ncbi:MAG: TonB-dependent receptor plug domain-containing protein [Algicola sp.]|nr:TonB-dependent receptor plug domain-containing protein [Algicola sp.]